MSTPQGQGAKAIFVDGPSAHWMQRTLGIEHISFPGLFSVLRNRVGDCRVLAAPPLLTVHTGIGAQKNGLLKQAAGAGFETLAVESQGGADDAAIKARIRALDSKQVSEIVIVSCDRDFVPELLCKVSQGVIVHWVATRLPSPRDGNCCISADLEHQFSEGAFRFVELAAYRSVLAPEPAQGAVVCQSKAGTCDDLTEIVLKLRSTVQPRHRMLAQQVQRLRELLPELSVTVRA